MPLLYESAVLSKRMKLRKPKIRFNWINDMQRLRKGKSRGKKARPRHGTSPEAGASIVEGLEAVIVDKKRNPGSKTVPRKEKKTVNK